MQINGAERKRVFARVDAAHFVGRASDVERLLTPAKGPGRSAGLTVLAAPNSGCSELLRQVYDSLFHEQSDVIPFYFELAGNDVDVPGAARRFLDEFLLQTVAFRRRDTGLIDTSPDVNEISQLAVPADAQWIDRLVEAVGSADGPSIETLLSAPLRAAARGARCFVLIDGLERAAQMPDGHVFLSVLTRAFERARFPFVFAGARRFLFGKTSFPAIRLAPLAFADRTRIIEHLANRAEIPITDQARDLIAVQLGANLRYIESFLRAAASSDAGFASFDDVERAYAQAIVGGEISRVIEAVLDRALMGRAHQSADLLYAVSTARGGKVTVDYWRAHAHLDDKACDLMLSALHTNEIVNVGSGYVTPELENLPLQDYISARNRLESLANERALVFAKSLTYYARRAPQLMSRFYRKSSAIGLCNLLRDFNGQSVSSALLDYSRFANELKGKDDPSILDELREDTQRVTLARILHCSETEHFYPRMADFCDAERSAVAFGDDDIWIAAEVESKLEATYDVAEMWCDRLELVALNCEFSRYKLWLIAPEGFDPDALSLLNERGAYGSSRKQAELLASVLRGGADSTVEPVASEYRIEIPMGPDTEIIAAHTFEDIARRHKVPPQSINQMKTALIESCINASEHSMSPDRRIQIGFAVDHGRFTISVANRGVRLGDKAEPSAKPSGARRGWGMKLIRDLMDEVTLEKTDDGTTLTMTKLIPNPDE